MARVSRKGSQPKADVPAAGRVYDTAVYVRLSVENNRYSEDAESIATQQYMLEKYVEGQPDMRLAGVFCDNGQSGTDFDRPGFEGMMDEVRKRKVDCIVVKDLSRFGRNYVEAGCYLEKIFPGLGIRFVSVNDGYDTLKHGSGDELLTSLRNLLNDLYAKDISRKIRSTLVTKQKNGEYVGGKVAYGYLRSSEDKHKLVVDPETAPIVREIFRKRLEGQGFWRIARSLNERGVPCPSMYLYQHGKKKEMPKGRGALWQAQVVRKITINLVYAGHLAQGRFVQSLSEGIPVRNVARKDWIVVKDTHEAIVDQDTFDIVQELTERRREEYEARHRKFESWEDIFKGLLICRDCNTKMRRYKKNRDTGVIYFYGCGLYSSYMGGKSCVRKYVREDILKECVTCALQVQANLAAKLEKGLGHRQVQQKVQKMSKELADEIKCMEQKARRNATLRGSLFESYSEGLLTEKEYLSMKEQYGKEGEGLKERLLQLQKEKKELECSFTPKNKWIEALGKYRGEKELTSEMVRELIKCIYVSGYNEIEIVWNFKDEFARLARETGVDL